MSIRYKIKVIYKDFHPDVYLLEPKFDVGTRRPPHLYSFSQQKLCLYLPGKQDWSSSMNLADTIIPWACEWLFFYEMWLITGSWYGGGEHLEAKD